MSNDATGDLQPLLTPDQVAILLAIPVKRLYTWRLSGKGPRFVKVGHNLRYQPTDVAEYIAANTWTPKKTI